MAGVLSGGWLGGWLGARGRSDANLRVGMLSQLLILPAGLLAPTLAGADAALAAFALFLLRGEHAVWRGRRGAHADHAQSDARRR